MEIKNIVIRENEITVLVEDSVKKTLPVCTQSDLFLAMHPSVTTVVMQISHDQHFCYERVIYWMEDMSSLIEYISEDGFPLEDYNNLKNWVQECISV